MSLPKIAETFRTLEASAEAKEVLERILERKQELEDMVQIIQPLLYTISLALYGEDDSDVSLDKLVTDAVNFINGVDEKETLQ
jgi:hypothetical protein